LRGVVVIELNVHYYTYIYDAAKQGLSLEDNKLPSKLYQLFQRKLSQSLDKTKGAFKTRRLIKCLAWQFTGISLCYFQEQ
jgi:hypothetical protein